MTYASRTKVLTIMIVDIVNYTSLSGMLGRERFDEVNEDFDRISLPLFEKYAGRVIKKIGDSFLVVFESATDSLHCAIELQNKFWEYRTSKAGVPLKIKVALNTGEVIIRNNDIYGEAVNVVSRVEKATKPGQIYFTQPVFLAMNKNEIPYVYIGSKRFKGVNHAVKLFRVRGLYEETRKGVAGLFAGFVSGLFKLVFWVAILALLGWLIYKLLSVAGLWDNVVNYTSNFINKFV
jgi:adenylate cyclase